MKVGWSFLDSTWMERFTAVDGVFEISQQVRTVIPSGEKSDVSNSAANEGAGDSTPTSLTPFLIPRIKWHLLRFPRSQLRFGLDAVGVALIVEVKLASSRPAPSIVEPLNRLPFRKRRDYRQQFFGSLWCHIIKVISGCSCSAERFPSSGLLWFSFMWLYVVGLPKPALCARARHVNVFLRGRY